MAVADRQSYWNNAVPCVNGYGHDWNSSTCVACGLHIRKHDRKKGKEKKLRLLKRDGNQCRYCSIVLTIETATVDHVIPLSKGGKDSLDNLVLACKPCNNDKADLLLSEWRKRRCRVVMVTRTS